MYKMYIAIGDWSGDGHSQCERILLESNVDVEQIQNAYKEACKLTNIQFHDEVCADFEEYSLSLDTFDKLEKFGLTENMLNDFGIDGSSADEFFINSPSTYIKLWIWFVKLALPSNFILQETVEKIPCINSGNKNLSVHFGYGLF